VGLSGSSWRMGWDGMEMGYTRCSWLVVFSVFFSYMGYKGVSDGASTHRVVFLFVVLERGIRNFGTP
jgi:hypothetical protein